MFAERILLYFPLYSAFDYKVRWWVFSTEVGCSPCEDVICCSAFLIISLQCWIPSWFLEHRSDPRHVRPNTIFEPEMELIIIKQNVIKDLMMSHIPALVFPHRLMMQETLSKYAGGNRMLKLSSNTGLSSPEVWRRPSEATGLVFLAFTTLPSPNSVTFP